MSEFKVASSGELQRFIDAALGKQRAEYGAPSATVEAVMFELREYGVAQFKKPNCQRRLADLSVAQVRQVIERLTAFAQNIRQSPTIYCCN